MEAWIYTSWITNYFDPDTRPVRLMLLGVMLASLVMSASIPEAFGDQGLVFAAAYVALNLGRTAFALAALGRRHHLTGIFQRALIWWSVTGLLWQAYGSGFPCRGWAAPARRITRSPGSTWRSAAGQYIVALLLCLLGKSSREEGDDSLGDGTRGGGPQ